MVGPPKMAIKTINKSSMSTSTSLSVIMDPKLVSNAIFSYLVITPALAISPILGIVRLAKYPIMMLKNTLDTFGLKPIDCTMSFHLKALKTLLSINKKQMRANQLILVDLKSCITLSTRLQSDNGMSLSWQSSKYLAF